jgi:pilus assembly protein Flp/PilA
VERSSLRLFIISVYLRLSLINTENIIMNILPKRQEGQGLVEYALILVMVAVVVIVILQLLGPSIVLSYARIMAGFDGITLNTSEPHGLVVSYTTDSLIQDGSNCTATVSDVFLVATDANGRIITNESVPFSIRAVGGVDPGTMTAEAPASGLIHIAGPLTRTGHCPIKLTVQR